MATADVNTNQVANGNATEKGNNTAVNGKNGEAHYKLPDAKTLQQVGELKIKDENGNEIPFKSLYENQPGQQLIVFIRHFYCGVRITYSSSFKLSMY